MTLDQLRYFFEAARFQHVGKAAKFVHISPSAISSAIAALEADLGRELFLRQGKAIILTDYGRTLKEEAEKLFEQIDGIKRKVQGDKTGLRGNYRFGASHFLASRVLTRAFGSLQGRHPELAGEICSLSTARVIQDLISGALDGGICFSPFRHPELEQQELYRGKLVLVVRREHPLLKLDAKPALKRLSEFPAAIHKSQPGIDICEFHPIFDRYGVVPQVKFLFDSDECAVEKIVSSDSWALVPDLVARAFQDQVQTIKRPLDWDAEYYVAAVMRRGVGSRPVQHLLWTETGKLLATIGRS